MNDPTRQMTMHQGNFGGPDCSNATDVAQCAMPTKDGVRKFTATPNAPGQFKILSNVLGGHFAEIMIGQEQNANCEFGFCGADGNLDAPGVVKGIDQQRVMLYHTARAGHSNDVSYEHFKYFYFKSLDGKPLTFTVGPGVAL